MKNVLLAALVIGLATTAAGGQAFADKASRQEKKAERQEKKAERAEKKAERQADMAKGKYGKWDSNEDGKMSFTEMKAKYDSRPAWSYRKDLAGMDIDYSKVSPTMTAILSAVGGSGGGQSAGGGEHNGAASDH